MESSEGSNEERIVSELKDAVDSQVRLLKIPSAPEDVRRDCATQLLNAVISFLSRWDNSLEVRNTPPTSSDYFPNGIVRDAFHTVLSEFGPGDAQVRATLLEALSSLRVSESRQALLDVLPWTMPVEANELEEATQQVLETLRQVLVEDSEALLPVLGCLSLLPLSGNGRVEAWNVALASLPIVSEADLPVLARTLLCNVTTDEDASRALDGLRTEFDLIQNGDDVHDDDPIPLIAHVLLGAFQDRENGPLITKAYLDILKRLTTRKVAGLHQEEGSAFLILDAVAVLALYQNYEVKSNVESLMDGWIKDNSFPFATLKLLVDTICQRHRPGGPASVLYKVLVPGLLSLGVFLLLAPVRVGTVDQQHGDDTLLFLLEFHHSLDRDYQDELVQCLLHLSEEASWDPEESSGARDGKKRQRRRSRSQVGKPCKHEGLAITANAVHKLLQHLTRTARSSVARFKRILVERLTSVPNDAALDNVNSTEQLCVILSCLVEPVIAEPGSGVGIDASEVIILLQKLLFTASYAVDRRSTMGESALDVGRVIRGIILATELVKSNALSWTDKECIHQWIHRILLPSTRRTVDPEIGSHSLHFLSAWSGWVNSRAADSTTTPATETKRSHDMFQSFKMILANTGLIQMLSLYLERRKRPQEVVLGYTCIPPPFLKYSNAVGRRKTRDMIFCVFSYVRTSNVRHPSRWGEMTIWVNNLVDTYLTMGREGSTEASSTHNTRGQTKWLPDGWLQASIELPNLNLVVERTGHKTKIAAELLSSQLCRHELTFENGRVPKSSCREIAHCLCEDRSLEEVGEHVESVLRLTLAFLLGIGLSAAVLRNTNAHLLHVMESEEWRLEENDFLQRRNEILKLMQYQVMKMYDLQTKCETSIWLLDALATTLRRVYLPGKERRRKRRTTSQSNGSESDIRVENSWRSALKIASTAEIACQQTRRVLSLVFRTSDNIDPAILLRCLVDANDEDALMEGLKASTHPSLDFKMIVEMRRSLLNHLSTMCSNKTTMHNVLACKSVTRVLSTASNVSRMLPAFRKTRGLAIGGKDTEEDADPEGDSDEITSSDVSGLSSSYFRFVKKILNEAAAQSAGTMDDNEASEEQKNDGDNFPNSGSVSDLLMQCAATMNAAANSSHATRLSAAKVCESSTFGACNAFKSHLRICEDEATALELIDILSILSSKNSTLAQSALECCWRVLHTVYTVSYRNVTESSTDVPDAFVNAVAMMNARSDDSVPRSDSKGQLVDTVLSATIVRTASSCAKHSQDNTILRHGVLLMWSVTASSGLQCSFDYLSKLTNELVRFLNDIDSSVHSPAFEERGEDPGNPTSQPRKKRDRPISSIQSLTSSSFSLQFELVLHATVATLVIAPCARTSEFGRVVGKTSEKKSPFLHLHNMAELFSRLLGVFVSKFHLFPRRMISVVLGACKHFFRACVFQIQGCIQWRNVQPILSVEEKRAGVHDYGAIKFLEQLLQSFATFGAGSVTVLCRSLRILCRSLDEESDGDYDGDNLLLGVSHTDKRVASVLLSAQKTMDALRDIASAHNLAAPQFDRESFEKLPSEQTGAATKRRQDDSDKGYHELDGDDSPIMAIEKERKENGEGANKRRRIAPTLVSVDANSTLDSKAQQSRIASGDPAMDDDEDEWDVSTSSQECSSDLDEGSHSSSDAFGVSGKWAEDDLEDQEDESSSGSLELEVSSTFQAT